VLFNDIGSRGDPKMQLKTILNSIEKYKSFVYSDARWSAGQKGKEIEFELTPRSNSQAICAGCGKKRPGYDRLESRRFEFVPLWSIPVFFVYAMRRVNCPECGIVVEQVPWASGKNQQTHSYRLFLASWAKRLSWQEVAKAFGTSWDSVFRAIQWVVEWGVVHRELSSIQSIGVDEIQYRRGHKYLTLVYQLDAGSKRLLYVAKDRTERSLNGFFDILDDTTRQGIQFACTDMWPAYLKVLKSRASKALNILDRFHIAKKFGEALDKVRAEESRQLKADGYDEVLKHSRWCLLKRKENLTTKQTVKLKELMKYNLRSVRAYLMREDFNRFWTYTSAIWAGKFLREWCRRTNQTNIEPMKKLAKTLRKHEPLLLNWFESQGLSSGVVEGFNNKAKLAMRKAYGFKEYETIEIALYHQLGKLPEPETTHRFC
jgi:transposase